MARFLKNIVLFVKNFWGTVNSPYVTYRKLSGGKTDPAQTLFIFLLAIIYFALSSIIKSGFQNPFVLTFKFNSLLFFFAVSFFLNVFLLNLLGKNVGGQPSAKSIFVLWSYTLFPTIIWFYFTTFMYIILPPPRTYSILGKLYSIVYIALSLSLLYWKLILYYLTLRFGIKIDMKKIIKISAVFFPFQLIYASFSYKLGIFKIPFI